jgi:hypothetical protein
MSKDDKALLRALAWQLVGLAMMKAPKSVRYEEAANACDQVAARLRERAAQAG